MRKVRECNKDDGAAVQKEERKHMRIDIWMIYPEEHLVFREVDQYFFECRGKFIEIRSGNRIDYINTINVSHVTVKDIPEVD